MSEPDLSTLPNRMRYAAQVLMEARDYEDPRKMALYQPVQLLKLADKVEAEEEAEAEQQRMVDQLVEDLCQARYGFLTLQNRIDCARELIAAGWTKALL